MDPNFSVPEPDKAKLLHDRQTAQDAAWKGAPPEGAAAPHPEAGPPTFTVEQLQQAGAEWPGLTPQETEGLLAGVFSPIIEWRGHAALSPDETKRGGVALTPTLNKWAPYLLRQHADLLVASVWVASVVRARKKQPARAPRTAEEARTLLRELEAQGRVVPKNQDEARKLLAELEAKEKAA